MSPGKLGVLGRLHHEGATSPGALAMAQGVQPQSLTRLLAELEEESLVSRRIDPHDRRQHVIEITAAGRKALQSVARDYVGWLANTISTQFSPIERELLWVAIQLLNRLTTASANDSNGLKHDAAQFAS